MYVYIHTVHALTAHLNNHYKNLLTCNCRNFHCLVDDVNVMWMWLSHACSLPDPVLRRLTTSDGIPFIYIQASCEPVDGI